MSSDSEVGDAGDGVEDVRVLGWGQQEAQATNRPLGEWEKHTTVRERERERDFNCLLVTSSCCSHLFTGIWFQAFGQNGLCSRVSIEVKCDGGWLYRHIHELKETCRFS